MSTHYDGSPCTRACPWGTATHWRMLAATVAISVSTTDGEPPLATWEVTVPTTDLTEDGARQAVLTLARQLDDEEEELSAARCDVCASPVHDGRCVNCGRRVP